MTGAHLAVRIGGRPVPVVFPGPGDPRLHTAAVIITIHVIGVTTLGFRVSVPQILSAIVAAALLEIGVTLRSTGKLVWPASAMLTGSGVALILRLVGMDSGDYWSWTGWYWFAVVAAVSVLTKYLIRVRGEHLFNPSNIGLVAAFIVLGGGRVEPLDFWWAPLDFWMVLAYVVIVVGGVLITQRLRLLEMAFVYWVALVAGLAVLAASGHCMTAAWSPTPVCDWRFWSVLVTSPEVLVFLFFMITDPKTIPRGHLARVGFAVTLGLVSVLLIAPHAFEFGAKVGLLASLALWSPLRWVFDRVLPDSGTTRLSGRLGWLRQRTSKTAFARGVATGTALVFAAVAIVAAGSPARDGQVATMVTARAFESNIERSMLPEVSLNDSLRRAGLDEELADLLVVALAENLAIEAEAMRTADGVLLGIADGGRRLDEMQARLEEAIATGDRPVDEYTFDSLQLSVDRAEGEQASLGVVVQGEGTVERRWHDAMGTELTRERVEFSGAFVLRQLAGERWLIVDFDDER